MIFARDKSQMCNNLLQYAHVYAWGREHGRKVISMRFSYKYKFFKISHSNLVSFPLYLLAKYGAALRLIPTASFKHEDCDAAALEQLMLRKRHIVVSGWYARFYDLFLKYRNEICDLFTIDPQYTEPVDNKMSECEGGTAGKPIVRLGVHIRRGDYAQWKDGMYCYDDATYADYIRQFAGLFPGHVVHVYLATNDPAVSASTFESLTDDADIHIHHLAGNAVEDLHMLSQCDFIIGPPSTYSLVAAMYSDIPLCRLDTLRPTTGDAPEMTLSHFKLFDHWFREIV